MVFEDRVSKYPGRWTMVKSDGSSEIVTLVRNDEPTKEGTPINAKTLNTLSTVAGAINAKEEAVAAAKTATSERAKAEQAATNAANEVKADLKEYSDNAASSAAAAATSESNAKTSETESAKNLQGTKEYFEQVRTITIGAQGWYATPEALKAAVPIGENGWWAVVGTTDTIWTWDSDTGAWVNTQAKVDLSDFYTQAQVDALLKEQQLKDHPVGSAFFTISDDDPAQLFGGTWMKIAEDRAIMGSSTTHAAGSTAEAGLPNIAGNLFSHQAGGGSGPFRGNSNSVTSDGALSLTGISATYAGYAKYGGTEYSVHFDASASNSIYGASNTVQPPTYYFNIWIRVT